jgi:hypothetical protein
VQRTDSLLIPLIKQLGIEDDISFVDIRRKWDQLFNKPLSYHMSPRKLSNGEILIHVDSPVWLQELHFYKDEILRKLHPYGVKAVRFKLGRVSTEIESKAKSQKSKVKPLTNEELSYIENTVSGINDQDLRDKIRKAMGKSVAKKNLKF